MLRFVRLAPHRVGQRGDTIVEVLIALTILASALGIAYATAHRSLRNSRQAQEHGEAYKLAESQLEALRNLSGSPAQNVFNSTTGYCIDTTTMTVVPLTSNYFPNANPNSEVFANFPAACTKGLYRVGVRYTPNTPAAGNDTFKVYVRWDSIRGGGRDQEILTYRMHP
jgi:prepilin-type N-terminal cleavage/methylation domain-containing protein